MDFVLIRQKDAILRSCSCMGGRNEVCRHASSVQLPIRNSLRLVIMWSLPTIIPVIPFGVSIAPLTSARCHRITRGLTRSLALGYLVLSCILTLHCQLRSNSMDSLFVVADSLQRRGECERAKGLYQSILDHDAGCLRARESLGKVLMTEGFWRDALREFEEALDQDPNDPAAHYGAGMCYREVARDVRLTTYWREAEGHFRWIMERDSLYHDVLLQYALTLMYRGKEEKAFGFANRQVILKPFDPIAWTGLFRFYRVFLFSHSDADKYFEGQSGDIARYFLGECWREKGRIAEAKSIFDSLSRAKLTIPLQPVYLSLARVFYRTGDTNTAERYYWKAIDEASTPRDAAFLFEDVKYISTPEEIDLFRSVKSNEQQKRLFRGFWYRRNPDLAATLNARLAEHYQRLLYAEDNFQCDMYRQKSFAAEFNYPALDQPNFLLADGPFIHDFSSYALNQEFDDRGFVYIRQGPPSSIVRTPGDSIPPNETWVYNPTASRPRLICEFHEMSSFHNEWRLGYPVWNGQILDERMTLDRTYALMLQGTPQAMGEVRAQFKENADIATTTELHSSEERQETIDIATSLTMFRTDQNKTLVDISYAVPLKFLTKKQIMTPGSVNLEMGLTVFDHVGTALSHRTDTIKAAFTDLSKAVYFGFYRFAVPADSYRIALQALPLGYRAAGRWESAVRIRDYTERQLNLSDIEILRPAEGKSVMQVDGIMVMPSPLSLHRTDEPLRTYVQVYHLTQNPEGKTAYTLEYRLDRMKSNFGFFGKLARVFGAGKKESLSFSFEDVGDQESTSHYVPLSVEDLEPGEYTLSVKVNDRLTDHTIKRSRVIEIVEY